MTHPLVSYPQLPDTPTSHLPFSPCVVVGDLIFVSGQASACGSGVSIEGSVLLQINTMTTAIDTVVDVGGTDVVIKIAAAPAANDPFFSLTASDVTVTIGGP